MDESEAFGGIEDPGARPSEDAAAENDRDGGHRYWATDTGVLPLDTRRALVKLVQGPYVSAERQSELWRAVVNDERVLASRLSDMLLELVVDHDARIAFVRNAPDQPTVVRAANLSFLETALVLHLRGELLRSDRNERVVVGKEDVKESLRVYGDAQNLDDTLFAKRFNAAWSTMDTNGLLTKTGTAEDRFEISPVLRILFDSDEVRAVKAEFARMLEEES
ncbi:hypothetical protein GCM10009755_10360 [Brevibacterium samyangense]|uniref:DUF4194 domain-containing protein n=1 Tax=Brevibacterium samyangense TaxID=366888 RepID=A0ABN2TAD5_9MICO